MRSMVEGAPKAQPPLADRDNAASRPLPHALRARSPSPRQARGGFSYLRPFPPATRQKIPTRHKLPPAPLL